MLTRAIHAAISADLDVIAAAAQWNFGSGLVPAVFTWEPAPAECPNPIVVIIQTGGDDDSFRGKQKDDIQHTIKVWGDKTGSDEALRDLAWHVREAVNRKSLTVTGCSKHWGTASVPARVLDPDGFPGYIITVTSWVTYSTP